MLKAFYPLPGIDKRATEFLAKNRWVNAQWVRTVGATVQTIKGWVKLQLDQAFEGVCRGMHSWSANNGQRRLSLGTHKRLYDVDGNKLLNITPYDRTSDDGGESPLVDPFTTAAGSNVVTVAHTAHGRTDMTYVYFSGATPVGGITIDGEYVVSLIDANSYSITHSSAASSSASGGGTVGWKYEINAGNEVGLPTFGYGVGAYGAETYGTARTLAQLILAARTWSLGNWGEDLLANPRGGNIYQYDISVAGRAALLANAPKAVQAIFITPERHVVAIEPDDNRMRVGWSDQGNNTIWTAAVDNQAGDVELAGGSRLVAGGNVKDGINLVWSDTECFRMLYLAQEPWYGFRRQGTGAGLIGPNAWCEMNGVAYWMGNSSFYMWDGRLRELQNLEDIRDFVFNDTLNKNRNEQVICLRQTDYQEIWWMYPDKTDEHLVRYVFHSLRERRWMIGTWKITAAIDDEVFDEIRFAHDDGCVYVGETGEDAAGAPLEKYVDGLFSLSDDGRSMDVWGIVPDFADQSGDVTISLFTRDHPQGAESAEESQASAVGTDLLDFRASGKQARIRTASNVLGGKFRLGLMRIELDYAGRRR